MPAEVLKQAQVEINDKLFFEVDKEKRIIITKKPVPKKGTLEYLFKDYDEGAFQTELVDLGEPVGNEQW
jgi:antitoxin component of MazEF toxin-antitoxin module